MTLVLQILGFIVAFYAALLILWGGLRLVLAILDAIIEHNSKV